MKSRGTTKVYGREAKTGVLCSRTSSGEFYLWLCLGLTLHLKQRKGLLPLAIARLQQDAFNPAKLFSQASIDLGRISREGFKKNEPNDSPSFLFGKN